MHMIGYKHIPVISILFSGPMGYAYNRNAVYKLFPWVSRRIYFRTSVVQYFSWASARRVRGLPLAQARAAAIKPIPCCFTRFYNFSIVSSHSQNIISSKVNVGFRDHWWDLMLFDLPHFLNWKYLSSLPMMKWTRDYKLFLVFWTHLCSRHVSRQCSLAGI